MHRDTIPIYDYFYIFKNFERIAFARKIFLCLGKFNQVKLGLILKASFRVMISMGLVGLHELFTYNRVENL